jgi:hypothetical protein
VSGHCTRAEQALESFLQLRPRKIRVILSGRRQPRIDTSRMLVSGELIQLDGEDLRFRSWEVEQLFRAVYDAPLSPEAAEPAGRHTAGHPTVPLGAATPRCPLGQQPEIRHDRSERPSRKGQMTWKNRASCIAVKLNT